MFKKYFKIINKIKKFSSISGNFEPSIHKKRIQAFLNLAGNPEKKISFIHIAGTSGKGTVAELMHKMLCSAGHSSGVFTSPHTISAIERIKSGSLYISPKKFVAIFEKKVWPKIHSTEYVKTFGEMSFFEICLCVSLVYFAEKKCEYAILEAGIGGEFDATNFIEKPAAAIITNIGYDHTEILGKTLGKIAGDKAGIIKTNSHFYTAERRKKILKIFKSRCLEKKCAFLKLKSDVPLEMKNEELAKMAVQDLAVPSKAQLEVLKNFKIPCRFEQISEKPKIILDGAHNPAKISFLINKIKKSGLKNIVTIFASAKDKDAKTMLKRLLKVSDVIFLTEPILKGTKEFFSPDELVSIAKKNIIGKNSAKIKIFLEPNPNRALKRAKKIAGSKGTILVTGSFYLAGEIRRLFYSEKFILTKRKSF